MAAKPDSLESPLLKIERGKADICHLRRRVEIWAICGIGSHEGFAPNAVNADTQCHDAVWWASALQAPNARRFRNLYDKRQ
jgi:hypothetical protein